MKPFLLGGGIDQVTPKAAVAPGRLEDCYNYEVGIQPGYVTSEGFERFDGRMSPSTRDIWDITVATHQFTPAYVDSQSVGTTDTATSGVAFSTDGYHCYTVGQTNDNVYQFYLRTPWDISTAIYTGKSLDVSSQTTAPTNVFVSEDGTGVYVCSAGTIYQYTLSVAYDLSSGSYASKSYTPSAYETTIQAICFGNSGGYLYFVGNDNLTIYRVTLTTAWDVSTVSGSPQSDTIDSTETDVRGLAVDENGYRFYVVGQAADRVSTYMSQLSAPWNPYFTEYNYLDISGQTSACTGMALRPDGSGLYICSASTIYEYAMTPQVNEAMTWVKDNDSGDVGVVIDVTPGYFITTLRYAYWTADEKIPNSATVTGSTKGASFINGFRGCLYTSEAASVAAETTSPRCVRTFGGTSYNFFVLSGSSFAIYQYTGNLNDFSSSSYSTNSFAADSHEANPYSFEKSASKLFIGGAGNVIYQYSTSPSDISASTYDSVSLTVLDDVGEIRGIRTASTGRRLYVLGSSGIILQYNLSTQYDLTTATYYGQFDARNNVDYDEYADLTVENGGTDFYLTNGTQKRVYHFEMATALDITTAYYSGDYFSVSSQDSAPVSAEVYVSGARTIMWVAGDTNNSIFQYHLGYEGTKTALKDIATDADDYFDLLYACSQVLRGAIKAVPGSGPAPGIKWYKNQQTAIRDYAKFNFYDGTVVEPQIGQHVVVADNAAGVYHYGDEGIVHDVDVTAGSFGANAATGTMVVEPLGEQFGFGTAFIPGARNDLIVLSELHFTSGSIEPTQGVTLEGQSSGTTVVVYRVETQTGAWADGDATGVIYCYAIDGEFTDGEAIQINPAAIDALTFGVCLYGSSSVSGILKHESDDHSGSDYAGLYQSSRTGWSRIDLGHEISFNQGLTTPTPVVFGADTTSQTTTSTDWLVPTQIRDMGGWSASVGDVIDAVDTSGGEYAYPDAQAGHPNLEESRFYLAAYSFGLEVPTGSRITGIEIEVTAKNTAAATSGGALIQVQPFVNDPFIYEGGSIPGIVPKRQAIGDLTTSFVAYTFGGDTDLWGADITKAIVENSQFGVKLKMEWEAAAAGTAMQIDYIRMRVHYVEQGSRIYFYDEDTSTDYTDARLVHYNKESGSFAANTETIANGGFVADTNWTKGTGWTISGGTASSDGTQTGDSDLEQGGSLVEGSTYNVVFTVSGYSAGNVCAVVGDTEGTDRSANGTYSELVVCGSNSDFFIRADADFVGDIDNVSCKLVGSAKGTMQIYDLHKKQIPTQNIQIRTGADGSGNLLGTMVGGERLVSLPGSKLVKAADAKYEMIAENVYARDDLEAVYGVSGAGPAFSYDGYYVRLIRTGLSPELDKPRHVALFQFRLWLGYGFGEAAISVAGNPLSFDGSLNAVATGFGRPVTGFVPLSGKTMGVLTDQSTYAVTVDGADFDQQVFAPRVGAIEYTAQQTGVAPMYADARGISTPEATDKYGDFQVGRVSHNAHPWLLPRLQGRVLGASQRNQRVVAASVSRAKAQYRLYFADGYRLTLSMSGEMPQITRQFLYTGADTSQYIKVFATDHDVDDLGHDRMFFTMDINPDYDHGADLGYVYEEDRGTSYDGSAYKRYIELSPIAGDSIDRNNVWSVLHLYGMAHGHAPLSMTTAVDFAHPLDADNTTEDSRYDIDFGATTSDVAIELQPYWEKTRVKRRGRHLSLRFQNSSNKELPHIMQNITILDTKDARTER